MRTDPSKSRARAEKRQERVKDNAALAGIPQRPRKAKRKKSPTLSKLKKLLWEELRHVVYSESPDKCVSCGSGAEPVACHIWPSSDGAATRFFLPNIYRGCQSCNDAERRRRALWVKRHEEIFGADFVDALFELSRTTFQIKKHWVLEQTERMRKLRKEIP